MRSALRHANGPRKRFLEATLLTQSSRRATDRKGPELWCGSKSRCGRTVIKMGCTVMVAGFDSLFNSLK